MQQPTDWRHMQHPIDWRPSRRRRVSEHIARAAADGALQGEHLQRVEKWCWAAPVHLERVRWSPQWGGSRDCEARWQWRRAPPRFVKMCQHQRRACCLQPVLPRPLGASLWGAGCGASLWAAGCGTHVNSVYERLTGDRRVYIVG